MKITIKQAFDGYPDGDDKAPQHFDQGSEVEVADEFGKLVVGKGLAEEAVRPPVIKSRQPQVDVNEAQ